MRQYGDLDLIVRAKDIERATKAMIELGFELKIFAPHDPSQQDSRRIRLHEAR